MTEKPLTIEIVRKHIDFSKKTIKLFMDYDRKSFIKDVDYDDKIKKNLGELSNINLLSALLIDKLDSSDIKKDVREALKEELVQLIETTHEIITKRIR